MKRIYEIHDLQAYINWAYFYHAWQLHSTEQQQQSRAEAEQVLHQLDGRYRAYAIFQLFDIIASWYATANCKNSPASTAIT